MTEITHFHKLDEEITVLAEEVMLPGLLNIPDAAQGVVLFAHGSGSSRLSQRNRRVADTLNHAGIGTLLMDLLTEKEDTLYEKRFNIPLLAERLAYGLRWLKNNLRLSGLNVGIFGASTGAAAALHITAEFPGLIQAVVSRGGRVDLAKNVLPRVKAPTLFIVGGNDETVRELNEECLPLLGGVKELLIIPGATHLFEESGALEQVADEATHWFLKYL